MNSRITWTGRALAAFALVTLCAAGAMADSSTVIYQGVLRTDLQIPVADGDYAMAFSIWDAETGGTQVWGPEQHNSVSTANGMYAVYLGGDVPLGTLFADHSALWLEVSADIGNGQQTYGPRAPLASAPYAKHVKRTNSVVHADTATHATNAANATNATNADNADNADNLGGNPPSAFSPASHEHAASDITSGALNIDRLPVGTGSNQVARGDHRHMDRPYFAGRAGAETSGYKSLSASDANGITVSNGNRLVAPVDGRYFVHFQQLTQTDTQSTYLQMHRNGNVLAYGYMPSGISHRDMIVARVVNMNAGDYIQFYVATNVQNHAWSGNHSSVNMRLISY
ncbi:MAG: hypothetical protein ACLFTT_10425 [Candidatus Hydrogenedentota bacterium]